MVIAGVALCVHLREPLVDSSVSFAPVTAFFLVLDETWAGRWVFHTISSVSCFHLRNPCCELKIVNQVTVVIEGWIDQWQFEE